MRKISLIFSLDKLDGIRPRGTKRKAHNSPLADDLDDDPYDEREEDMRLGKKRVSRIVALKAVFCARSVSVYN